MPDVPVRGIIAYGAYVPYYRLQKAAITAALGTGGGRGTRAVASYDEDATSMAVEASRTAMKTAPDGLVPESVYFASATPPYLDKTNANVIHAALDLPSRVFAGDVGGAPRSVNAALRSALDGSRPTLVVAADVRSGRPGSSDEANTGDAAVAWLIGDDERRSGHRRVVRRGIVHRRVPRPVAPAGVELLPSVGRTIRRARLPAAGDRSGRSGVQGVPSGAGRHRRRGARRVARPGRRGAAQAAGVDATNVDRRPDRGARQHRHAPRRAGAGLGARQRRAGADDHGHPSRRRVSTSASTGPPTPSPSTAPAKTVADQVEAATTRSTTTPS